MSATSGPSDLTAMVIQRFNFLETEARRIEDARLADKALIETRLQKIETDHAVVIDQMTTLVKAFTAARTAFYSLSVAILAAAFLVVVHAV